MHCPCVCADIHASARKVTAATFCSDTEWSAEGKQSEIRDDRFKLWRIGHRDSPMMMMMSQDLTYGGGGPRHFLLAMRRFLVASMS